MVSYMAKTKKAAEARAKKARAMGYNASVYKKEKGYGISVTRKK